MQDEAIDVGASTQLSNRDFHRLSKYIYSHTGIKMPITKKSMLQARLQKRLRHLQLNSYEEYCNLVFNDQCPQDELVHMIDVVTTNKTDFFREPEHFIYLMQEALPTLIRERNLWGHELRVWSTACSSGQEPYTLAMVLANYAETHQGFSYSILGTDISTFVLGKAMRAVYLKEDAQPVPEEFKKKYLLRSKDRSLDLVKIVPELRATVELRRLNLMDDDFGITKPFEIMFCRNVIIYFDRPTQAILLRKLYNLMTPGGYLFMGHSESLSGLDVPLELVAPTVYRKHRHTV